MFKQAVVTRTGMKKKFFINDEETDCNHAVKYEFFHYSMTFTAEEFYLLEYHAARRNMSPPSSGSPKSR
jgi:hypothetical protein